MKLQNYLKRFKRVALVNHFKSCTEFHSILLGEEPAPDCLLFVELDFDFFDVLSTDGLKMVNHYVLNAKEIDPIVLPSMESTNFRENAGRVFTFDLFIIGDHDKGKLVKSAVVFSNMNSLIDDYLIPNNIRIKDASWLTYGGYDEEEVVALANAIRPLGVERLLEHQNEGFISKVRPNEYREIKRFIDAERHFDGHPVILWDTKTNSDKDA